MSNGPEEKKRTLKERFLTPWKGVVFGFATLAAVFALLFPIARTVSRIEQSINILSIKVEAIINNQPEHIKTEILKEIGLKVLAQVENSQKFSYTIFSSPSKVYYRNLNGKKEKVIPFDGIASNGMWSFDKKKIAFQGRAISEDPKKINPINIYIFDLENKKISNLTKDNGDNIHPFWDPSGDKIWFCSNRTKYKIEYKDCYDLYVMKIDESDARLVLDSEKVYKDQPDKLSINLPSVSPDGNIIGFSTSYEENWNLWIMPSDKLENRKKISDWGFCRLNWNPANKNEVVFVRDRRNVNKEYKDFGDIIIADLFANECQNIIFKEKENLTKKYFSEYPKCPSENFPDWNSSGTHLILASCESENKKCNLEDTWILYIRDKEGRERNLVAGQKIYAVQPNW